MIQSFSMQEEGFPFSDMKLRKLAYELAVASKRKGFSPVKKCAGPWWLKGFLKRWSQLYLLPSLGSLCQCLPSGQVLQAVQKPHQNIPAYLQAIQHMEH